MFKKKKWKSITSLLIALAIIIPDTSIVYANTYVTDVRNYTVTAQDGSGITNTVSYTKDGITTTLNKKSVDYTVAQTKQVPVYRTDTKNITIQIQGGSSASSYSNTYNYSGSDGFKGTLTKAGNPFVTSGSYTPADTKTVTDYISSYSRTPSSEYYNSGGYSGTLYGGTENATVVSGSYTPASSFTATASQSGTYGDTSSSHFPTSVYYNSNGYSGYLYRTGINWTLVSNITGRTSPVLTQTAYSDWLTGPGPIPSYYSVSYYDSATGQTVYGSIPYQSVTAISSRTATTRQYYSRTDISWMSNSPYYYGYGRWSDPYPAWFHDDYGPGPGWVKYANDWYGSVWGYGGVSDTGIYNKYGRNVYQAWYKDTSVTEYQYKTVYSGTLPLPNITTYSGTATYSGTVTKPASDTRVYLYSRYYSGSVTKPASDTRTYAEYYTGSVTGQVVDHYDTVPISWTAKVSYDGYMNYPPIADFTMPSYGFTGNQITVLNTSKDIDGVIVSNNWSLSNSSGVTNALSSNGGNLTFANAGTYNLTLVVKDNDGATASVTKSIKIYKDTDKPQVTLQVTPNPVDEDKPVTYTDTMSCPNGIEKYVYTLTNLDTNETHQYTNSKPPAVFEDAGLPSGIYKVALKALGKSIDYGNGIVANGKWSDEVSVILDVEASLKIKALKLTNIVNPPLGTTAPINYPVSTPTKIKAGYNMTFNLNVKSGDKLTVKVFADGKPIDVYTDAGKTSEIVINKPISQSDVSFTYYLDKDTPKGSVIDMKFTLSKQYNNGTTKSIIDNTLGWRYGQVVGSSKEDIMINLTN